MSFKSPLRGFPAYRASREVAMGLTPAFMPTDLSGLIFWADADAGTFQDTLYTVPAVADGDPVGGWQDQSGNANHITQAVAGSRLTLRLNVQNGLPVLRCAGGDYLFRASALGLGGSDTPMTIFIVAEADSFAANRTLVSFGSSASANPIHRVAMSSVPDYFVQRRADDLTVALFHNGIPVANTWYVITQIFYGTTLTIRVNAAVVGVEGTAFNVNALTVNRFAVGALLRAVPEQYHVGDIGEVVIYDSALSASDYGEVENYLNQKWAVY